MKLSKRLEKIASLIVDADCVIDVGCDHGYLAYELLRSGKSKRVLASDISEKCLDKTRELAKSKQLEDKLLCRVSDGLLEFKTDKADYVVIAGMGGNEIVKILANTPKIELFKTFILQPMQDVEVVREYLYKNGFEITVDQLVQERGKYYSIIQCVKAESKIEYSKEDVWFGKFEPKQKSFVFLNYCLWTRDSLKRRENYLDENDLKKLAFCEKILYENK